MDQAQIKIEDFKKIDLCVGLVQEASKVPESQKLIKLIVDFGNPSAGSGRGVRTIFTGLQAWYTPDDFTGKKFVFVYNLEPKKIINNEESQGMLLAVNGADKPLPVEAPVRSNPGDKLS